MSIRQVNGSSWPHITGSSMFDTLDVEHGQREEVDIEAPFDSSLKVGGSTRSWSRGKHAPQTIAKSVLTHNKLMICAWWDWKDIIYYELLPRAHGLQEYECGLRMVVTGCTDGIGKEYARQLAAKGCHIILVSRSMYKLEATAHEIENEYKVNTKIIKADFSEGDHIYENISKEIENLEIGTLVNNVGVFYDYPDYFLDTKDWEKTMNGFIRVNIESMIKMNNLVLPGMVKRKRGVVINLGSASALVPSPLLAVYGASKAFVDKFSRSLNIEYSRRGIVVQTVNPSNVMSNMTPHIKSSSIFGPTAKRYVRSALGTVGVVSRTTGYFPHDVLVGFVNCVEAISERFASWALLKWFEGVRDKQKKAYQNKSMI
ncbi:Very-long-chain 3-oxoacyl-CoA reductase [Eumeta japonica]|uniref:Very-long-chain 3-oxoacyl-CoA reductase n=1 Tax=Eumeta variegata TaxID=151549 RepID=A0A4C1UZ85_EUMVA|nr:Very-long-chain 3-oxoacyl-CoA reductase [Eumeta japonica]